MRLKHYDYTSPGGYFVTICTHNRERLFGEIVDGEMRTNEFGEIAQIEWWLLGLSRRTVTSDVSSVMPDHFHGILLIDDENYCGAATKPRRFGEPIPNSLASIVGGYKSGVSRRINELRGTSGAPVWQRNYYERVIRNDDELRRLREYVLMNPLLWEWEKEQSHPANAVGVKSRRIIRPKDRDLPSHP